MKYITLILMLLVPAVCGAWSLQWNQNTESDLAGYRVYMSQSGDSWGNPAIADTTETCYELNAAWDGAYFAVTAYDLVGNESQKSLAVHFVIPVPPDTTPPAVPGEPWINENVCGADITGDGVVNMLDYSMFRELFKQERGTKDCIRPLVIDEG